MTKWWSVLLDISSKSYLFHSPTFDTRRRGLSSFRLDKFVHKLHRLCDLAPTLLREIPPKKHQTPCQRLKEEQYGNRNHYRYNEWILIVVIVAIVIPSIAIVIIDIELWEQQQQHSSSSSNNNDLFTSGQDVGMVVDDSLARIFYVPEERVRFLIRRRKKS